MSCNCGHHGPIATPHNCNHINHVFDPAPPAFYGTWNHLYGHDVTNRVGMCQPGVSSGLYRDNGPLNCNCCGKITMLTGVSTEARLILSVSMHYSNSELDTTIDIEPGKIYTIDYLDEGKVCQCTGLVTNIYKIDQLDTSTNIYKINIDCSVQYSHNLIVLKSDQIRGVQKYSIYAGQDTKIDKAFHVYGTTISQKIENAVIKDAELDKERNIVRGTIVKGTLINAQTMGGICVGDNSNGVSIALNGATSRGGEITQGYVLNGMVSDGDIDGETEEVTGYILHATIKGTINHAVMINTIVDNANVSGTTGSIIEPVMENSTVHNGKITGEDMITTGGITSGDLTTGGITVGGTCTGGIATGKIGGVQFSIMNGNTTGNLQTTGGIVLGGTVIGGNKIGSVIYNATIRGGIALNGTTTGGITAVEINSESVKSFIKDSDTGTAIIPGVALSGQSPIAKSILQNPNYTAAMNALQRESLNYPMDRERTRKECLIVATDKATYNETYTNIGTVEMKQDP